MITRRFQMRLDCRYQGPDNTPSDLHVQTLDQGEWRDFQLGFATPGFLSFVYAILNCQHLYMRVNAAERGLQLAAATGSIQLSAAEDWRIEALEVHFDAELAAGTPTQNDNDYIVDRMRHCPVSVNLKEPPRSRTTLNFTRLVA